MEHLFEGLPVRNFRKGQILIYEGDNPQSIYYLLSGYVKAFDIRPSGDQRTIIIYSPGDVLPLLGLLSGHGTARYFHECMTDVDCQVLPAGEFLGRVHGNLEMGEEIINYTYQQNLELVERIETLSSQKAYQKVVALLNYLAGKTGAKKGGNLQLQIPLTTQDIAELCNLTRETTSVQLIKLKKAGVISGRRHLIIDEPGLKRLEEA